MIEAVHADLTDAMYRLERAVAAARRGEAAITANLDRFYAWCLSDVQANGQRDVELARAQQQEELAQARETAVRTIAEARDRLHADASCWMRLAGWDDASWAAYAPPFEASPPWSLRVGQLLSGTDELGPLPALAGLVEAGHLFIESEPAHRQEAIELLQALVLRLVVTAAPGTVRLTLVDPLAAGSDLAIFRRLPEPLRGAKIWSSAQEIEAQLASLIQHIEGVIQERLVTPDLTFEAYNRRMPEQQVRYQALVLADFPAGFSERAVELLLHIARNGPRAGVYLLVHVDSAGKLPHDLLLEDVTRCGTVMRFASGEQVTWDDPLLGRYAFVPDRLPPTESVEALLLAVGSASSRAVTDLEFGRIAVAALDYWEGSSLDGLEAPIGLAGSGALHLLRLGQDPGVVHHGLIGGTTGSGKGNLLHVLITQLALRYAPEELGFYLLDFKEGVEFQRYLTLPHARAVALESEREFGLNVLRHLQVEMEERGRLFKDAGTGIAKFAEYREQTGRPLPRLLLIIDEFQVLFKDDDAISRAAAQILEDLAKRGRSAAIHVLLCSQSPATGGQVLNRIYDQMGLRIALQCRTRDAFAILGDGNDAAARLDRVGDAIYNDKMGDKEKNQTIRVARLREHEWAQAQQTLARLARGRHYPPPVSFDGHAPAQLVENVALFDALTAPGWPAPGTAPRIWLGMPIDIKEPTAAALERYARSNLLVLGDDQAAGYGLLTSALLCLGAQLSPAQLEFALVDLTPSDSRFAGLFTRFRPAQDRPSFPHPLALAGPRQASALLDDLLARLAQRGAGDMPQPRVVLLVAGLHRWRELRGPDTLTQSEGARRLMRLAEEGPDLGINLVVWADGLTSVESVFKRGGCRLFDLRVALRLSERDSTELLGNSAAARLADNRALFRHEDWEAGKQEKFKPFQLPSPQEHDRLLGMLEAKADERGAIDGS